MLMNFSIGFLRLRRIVDDHHCHFVWFDVDYG